MTATKARSKKRRMYLEVGIAGGSVRIDEKDLPTIADAELRKLRISRKELRRCFEEGRRLMQGYTDRDRVRACRRSTQRRNMGGEPCLVLAFNDPLMQKPANGRAKRPRGDEWEPGGAKSFRGRN